MKKTLTILLLILCATLAGAQDYAYPVLTVQRKQQIIRHEGFTVNYNNETLCPNWVIWELTPEEASATLTGRTDYFTTDPSVNGRQAEYRDYSRNEYGMDRGHMAPSADFRWSVSANEQTFYLTNICPQAHSLNDGLWLELEQRCRAMAKRYGVPLLIVCGPVFGDTPQTIGKNKVSVPSAFFKAIELTVNGTTYHAAFIFPNKDLDKSESIFRYSVDAAALTETAKIIPYGNQTFSSVSENEYPWDIRWKKQ